MVGYLSTSSRRRPHVLVTLRVLPEAKLAAATTTVTWRCHLLVDLRSSPS